MEHIDLYKETILPQKSNLFGNVQKTRLTSPLNRMVNNRTIILYHISITYKAYLKI